MTIDNSVQSFLHFVGSPTLENATLLFGICVLSVDGGKLLNSLLEFEEVVEVSSVESNVKEDKESFVAAFL